MSDRDEFQYDESPDDRRKKAPVVIAILFALLLGLIAGYFIHPVVSGSVPTTISEPTDEASEPSVSPTDGQVGSDAPSVEPPAPTDAKPSDECTAFTDATTAQEQADVLLCEVYASQEPLGPPPPSDPDATTPPANTEPPEVILAGEEWFGSYGVNVCSSSSHEYCGEEPNREKHVGGVEYNWYQCVELVQRHYQEMGWHDGVFEGVGGAVDIYDKAESLGMERVAYNEVQEIASGDMIVHNSAGYDSVDAGAGHVSEVNYVIGNVVFAVEQNANASGKAAYIVIDNTLVRIDKRDDAVSSQVNTVKGVVHSPKNTANEPYQLRDGFDEQEFAQYLALVNGEIEEIE